MEKCPKCGMKTYVITYHNGGWIDKTYCPKHGIVKEEKTK